MRFFYLQLLILLALALPGRVLAADINSICRLQGVEPLSVSGIGVVNGLNGTGDKATAVKVMQKKYMEVLKYNLSLDDLSTKNMALVNVTAIIPPQSRVGDKIQLRVSSNGDATSLKDGTLQICNLSFFPGGEFVVRAEGRISSGDTPTTGIIEEGGQILSSSFLNRTVVDKNNVFRLLLNRANYSDAATIAQNINSDQRTNPAKGTVYGFPDGEAPVQIVARARDSKEVIVKIPDEFKNRQVEYIGVVLGLDIPLTSVAEIRINRQNGIVVITGDVHVMPGFISYRGRTVSLSQPQSTDGQAVAATYNADNETPRSMVDVYGPNESGGAGRRSLQSLVDTLAAMRCTTDDIIEILKKMKDSGVIQGNLVVE